MQDIFFPFFVCSLNTLLFWKSNFKMALILKTGYFDLLFTFLVTREKLQKFLQHISHSHTNVYYAHPIALPVLKKKYEFIRYGLSLV